MLLKGWNTEPGYRDNPMVGDDKQQLGSRSTIDLSQFTQYVIQMKLSNKPKSTYMCQTLDNFTLVSDNYQITRSIIEAQNVSRSFYKSKTSQTMMNECSNNQFL